MRRSAAKSSRLIRRSSPILRWLIPIQWGAGWFFKLKLANLSEVDALMDEAAYKALLG